MSLMELSLDTTDEAVDWVCTLLAEIIDIDDIEITKYLEQSQSKLAEQDLVQPPWTFTIRLHIPYNVHSRVTVEKIVNLLSPLHRTGLATTIQTTVVEAKSTGAGIHNPLVHRIGKRFVVLAPNAPYQSQVTDEVILRMQTSLAFGSGLHPATVLALQLLERYIVPTMNVLDLGSGSGILSVAIAKLGATVLALDNDAIAVQATQDAVVLNQVEQQVTVVEGSLGVGSDLGHWMGGITSNNVSKIESEPVFDLIVANILARVHIALADDFRRSLRQPGILTTAGFTTDHEENVVTALTEVGFEVIDCERFNEWVAFAYRLS
ncbi:50S ribosomal protein L11 methyltransferase [Nostocaceae cyanobacterium CENA357]|uniref:50S ribosomal protein L11 methyltransferase n=1 Tax=Atlanticothrix silvestris CENA357 TaxID=1725252 RepID=A0A8J7KYW9_9CYAN|nr:50S ribosomal protein L11 methyltransferase [Atlanticothrix silvestris]MBH8552725.1 50S ribosomal protein L11 methyltransferase [Atlanticothrix silvestris CENA357]